MTDTATDQNEEKTIVITTEELISKLKVSDVLPKYYAQMENKYGPEVMTNAVIGKDGNKLCDVIAYCALFEDDDEESIVKAIQSILTTHDLVAIRRQYEKEQNWNYVAEDHAKLFPFDLNEIPFAEQVLEKLNYQKTNNTRLLAKFYFIFERGKFIKSYEVAALNLGSVTFKDADLVVRAQVIEEDTRFNIKSFYVEPSILEQINDPAKPQKDAN